MKKIVLLSLGGSLVVPSGIDFGFLKKFVIFINRNLDRWRFIIVVGGGKICRDYQNTARMLSVKNRTDLDWVGIAATRLNAELVRSLFGSSAESSVLINPTGKIRFVKPILIAAGYKPGWSTDFDAMVLAKKFRAKRVINLSNIDFVYNRNPKKYRNAVPIIRTTWKKFRKIVGVNWVPGANLPLDPIASKFAQKYGIEAVITNGRDLKNLQKILDGDKFKGSIIR